MRSLPGRRTKILVFILMISLACLSGQADLSVKPTQEKIRLHYRTDWEIEPAFKYDALCFLNVLTGDPFYLKHYEKEYNKFKPLLTKQVKGSLASLKRKIKDQAKSIISALLCLYFSASDSATLIDMLKALEQSEDMQKKLTETPYYSEAGWRLFQSVKNDLEVIFHFLESIQFEWYWEKFIFPKITEKVRAMRKEVLKYNIVEEVEAHLGRRLLSRRITVYVLYFSKPHALKITGTRYLTNVDWPVEIALRNAVHELMHPPYDIKKDRELREALSRLKKDVFLMDKVLHHNPSFGYNTFEGFVEEDCVQALDQMTSERLGIALDPKKRWKTADDGMHVLAVALYSLMKKHKFRESGESFRNFLLRMIHSDELSPGRIKTLNELFFKKTG